MKKRSKTKDKDTYDMYDSFMYAFDLVTNLAF